MISKVSGDFQKHTIRIGLALVLMFTFSNCKQPSEQQGPEKPKKAVDGVIVAVGDSLTAGFGVKEEDSYQSLLQQRLEAEGRHYRVIN
jgi:acyl-CoA thioesterase I